MRRADQGASRPTRRASTPKGGVAEVTRAHEGFADTDSPNGRLHPGAAATASQKKIGYKKEFLREILKEPRVRGKEVRLTYKLPMTVRTPLSKDNPQKEEFFTLYQMVEPMGVEPTASRVRF
jgi:hypothetical protein